jgi:nucleotide-binding universal stress UspA family protein
MMSAVRVVVWVVEGTWQGCVDAAARIIAPDAEVTLLHVTSSDAAAAAEAASAGLLGRARPGRETARRMDDVAGEEASELLAAAAARLGREDAERLHLQGRVEREVIGAVSENVDLLVAARDGDRARLGPHSLGHATRFVLDHAPCDVLLVWPDEPPGIGSMPPPPHEHRPPDGPDREGPPPPHRSA